MKPNQILENFSTHLKNVIAKAISLAASLKHDHVAPAHMLLALAEEDGSVAAEILKKNEFDTKHCFDYLSTLRTITIDMKESMARSTVSTLPELNPDAKKVLEKAMLMAYEHSHSHVGTEHLLHGLITIDSADIEEILSLANIDREAVEEQIHAVFHSTSKFPEIEDVASVMDRLEDMSQDMEEDEETESHGQMPMSPKTEAKQAKKPGPSALELFATKLTDTTIQETIDPVIGREKEIERVIHVLSRRNKNNPILVGEPGVGKTAIVEGLAKRIASGDVPAVLRNKHIFSLDLTLLISGTIYRGEFEARIKQLIDEVALHPDYILFIDEIHNIIGAGSNQGTMDAANILKPALARGKLRCIGATTFDEYKKYITNDPALERRFQAVRVEEPSKEDAKRILLGVKKYYDNFHNTDITEEAINTAVELSSRHIHDNFLPDKAIDLIDEASAAVRTKQKPTAQEERVLTLSKKLDILKKQKEECIQQEKLEKAIDLKEKIAKCEKELAKASVDPRRKSAKRSLVSKQDIIKVLSTRLNISPSTLAQTEWDQLKTLQTRLKKHIIGQDQVLKTVVTGLQRAHLGASPNSRRPMASFLFAGPSGVGKTALAKALAEELYHDPKALIRLDMSEFAEGHGVSKLLGSPAGYVGYKDRNRFTDELRQRPYSVVLLDEIDKAHPDVMKLLLQILDEGALTDSSGKILSFRNAVVVMTSNIGADVYKSAGIGFGGSVETARAAQSQTLRGRLEEAFSNAILGRLDAVCLFTPLTHDDVKLIAEKHIDDIMAHIKEKSGVRITVSEPALEQLLTDAKYQDMGARQVERVVEHIIHDSLVSILSKEKHKSAYKLVHADNAYKLV